MAGYHVGQMLGRKTILESCLNFTSTLEKRFFCCPIHQKAIRRWNLTFGKTLRQSSWRNDRLCAVPLLRKIKLQPSRSFIQVPQILKSTKRKEYSNRKLIGFSMDQLYHVVSHVEDYKYFLPWCRDSQVYEKKGGHVRCKLVIGFPPLVERYISVLTLVPPNLIVSECTQGELFNYMKAVWRFSPGLKGNPETSIVDFHVAFEFRSALHSHLSSMFFDEVAKKMVGAFEKRCEQIYGPSSLLRSRRKQTLGRRESNTIGERNLSESNLDPRNFLQNPNEHEEHLTGDTEGALTNN